MKVVLSGVPASLVPVGPPLQVERNLGRASGTHIDRLARQAVFVPFGSRELQAARRQLELGISERDEERVAAGRTSRVRRPGHPEREVEDRLAPGGVPLAIGRLDIEARRRRLAKFVEHRDTDAPRRCAEAETLNDHVAGIAASNRQREEIDVAQLVRSECDP